MEFLDHLALGFTHALTLQNLAWAFAGCLLGTLIGVLPGLGPLATIAMLVPFTYGLDPLAALIMLAGIYYGAQYGGSTTAILVALPGEVSSVVTVLEGHQMAKQGRAGVALMTAAVASFVAGTAGTLVLAAFATPLSRFAIGFGSPEFFSLMVVGLVGAAAMASSSLTKAVGMITIGVLLSLVGTDVNTGVARFTLGLDGLWDGIDLVAIAIGVFAFTEVVTHLEANQGREPEAARITSMVPTREDVRRAAPAAMRGTLLGAFIGILPGAGPAISSFGSYAIEKKLSRRGDFGTGAIEGLAGPEAANNAAAQCGFIPTLTLGIPGSGSLALMLGVMMIHNIQPGPQVVTNNPDLFWGLIASMWIGNLMLLVLNLPLVGIWVRLLRIPYRLLYPAILAFCAIGVYSVNNALFDVYLTVFFGLVGYLLRKLQLDPAPLILGFVLGKLMEENFRRSMIVSDGDLAIFVTRPVSLVLLMVGAVLLVLTLVPALRAQRDASLEAAD